MQVCLVLYVYVNVREMEAEAGISIEYEYQRVCVRGWLNIYVDICVYIVCMYVCVCVCVYIYIFIYHTTHTYTHTPKQAHTHISKQAHTTHTRDVLSLLQQNATHRTLIFCHFFSPSSKQLLSPPQKAPLSKRFLAEVARQVISVYRALRAPYIGEQSLNRALIEP